MKNVFLIFIFLLAVASCRNTKQAPKNTPVEVDNNIDDSATPLDTLEKYQSPPIIPQDPNNKPPDSLR